MLTITPEPEVLVGSPASLRLRFDRPMDRRRGRVRLVWGRISAHLFNARRKAWRWSLRDPELRWTPDGQTLTLGLPPGLLAGFRVRVEWSDLADPLGRPPAPCEPGGTISYVLAVARSGPLPPMHLSSTPRPHVTVRPDAVLELYADAPVGFMDPRRWLLEVDGAPQSFALRTNRNPPDWIFVHPTAPLPAGEARLVIPPDALRGTANQPLAAAWTGSWTVQGDPVVAAPHPTWSEPPPGFASLPRRNPRFALRFADRPVLLPSAQIAQRMTLVSADGRVLAAHPTVSHDPTPGHYRSLVLAFEADLPADTDLRLAWTGLQASASPGSMPFRTGSVRPIAPLANAASMFATPRGSFLQVHASVTGPVRSVRAVVDGWSQDLADTGSRAFNPAAGEAQRTFVTPTDAAPLPPVAAPALRSFAVELTDADGTRALPGVAFDFGAGAVTDLAAQWDDGLAVRWTEHAPADAVHLSVTRPDGTPLWSGLFAARLERAHVAAPWLDGERDALVQLWLVRARPEDDLWDYFVTEIRSRR